MNKFYFCDDNTYTDESGYGLNTATGVKGWVPACNLANG